MTDVRLLFPNDYIKAADLRGRDVTLTIARLQIESLRTDHGEQRKPVLTFRELAERPEGTPRKLVLNKTNGLQIAKSIGETETDRWPGHKITLYPTTTKAFGDVVDCVRVRERAPDVAATHEPPELGDEIPDGDLGLYV